MRCFAEGNGIMGLMGHMSLNIMPHIAHVAILNFAEIHTSGYGWKLVSIRL